MTRISSEETAARAAIELGKLSKTAGETAATVRAFGVAAHSISEAELLKRVADGTDENVWEILSQSADTILKRTKTRTPPDPLTAPWSDLLEER